MNQWYCVEFYIKTDPDLATLSVWVDGQLILSQTGLNIGGTVDSVRTGTSLRKRHHDTSLDVYSDNIVISNNYIGPESTQAEYTLTVNTVGSGTVTKNPNQATYTEGTDVTLTLFPADGWTFAGWSGDLTGSNNPETITMDSDKTVTATFTQKEYTLTVTVDPLSAGTVSANIPGPYHYGDVVTLTPTANPGYTFSGWSGDGVNGAGNTRIVTITGNMAVTATFDAESSEIIVDNVNAVYAGAWSSSTSMPGYYGTNYQYKYSGTGTNTATWSFNVPTTGAWEVFAMWTSYSNRATNAPYTINHAGGSTVVRVNQEINNGQWVSLGVFNFNAGAASIVLSDDANEIVIADAIKLIPTTAPAEILVDDTDCCIRWNVAFFHKHAWILRCRL